MQKKLLLANVFTFVTISICSAQSSDSAKSFRTFSGNAAVTNNGISLVPSFSLGKPAAMFNVSLAKRRFSIDTDFNFSLKAKPWYFLFWLRYKLVEKEKFKFTTGTHLGLNYHPLQLNGMIKNETLVADRYWVGELNPSYLLSKKISVGLYFLYSHGLDAGTVNSTNFITVNAAFTDIMLGNKFFLKCVPQLYYLRQDELHGWYATSAFTLARKNYPFSLSSVMNKAIKSEIKAGNDLVWNLVLNYSFGKKYVAQ